MGGVWLYVHPAFGLQASGPEQRVAALFCGTLTRGPKEPALGKRGLGAGQSSPGQHGHLERNVSCEYRSGDSQAQEEVKEGSW